MEGENRNTTNWLEWFAIFLDSKFRIPGTNIRFGIDPLIGLFPIIGSFFSYLFSLFLVFYMAKNGVSFTLLLRMLANIFIDFLIGNVPIVGQFADFIIKANLKNYYLYKNRLDRGQHKTNELKIIGLFIFVLLIPIAITVCLMVLFTKIYSCLLAY